MGAIRVVSLVPSLTEAIAQTPGGRAALIGATNWCTHPGDLDVARIGGTKNPDVQRIVELAPSVVVANEEENREPDLAALRAAGVNVYLTHIRTVAAAFDQLPRMLGACELPADPAWLRRAEQAWRTVHAPQQRRRAVIMVWRKPWMAVGRDTYAGDVLRRLGIDNVLEHYAERYPRVNLEQLPAHDVVVLPSEPYEFTRADGPEAFAAPSLLVDGRLLTWYGPAMREAAAGLQTVELVG